MAIQRTPRYLTPAKALAQQVRAQFVKALTGAAADLAKTISRQFDSLMQGRFSSMVQAQQMSNAQMAFEHTRTKWVASVQKLWQDAPQRAASDEESLSDLGELELIDDEVVERKILISRLASALSDAAGNEWRDLRLRVLSLEGREELPKRDVLRPETLAHVLLKAWTENGLTREMWLPVAGTVAAALGVHMTEVYRQLNEALIKQGVMDKIDMRRQVRRDAVGAPTQPGRLSEQPTHPPSSYPPSAYRGQPPLRGQPPAAGGSGYYPAASGYGGYAAGAPRSGYPSSGYGYGAPRSGYPSSGYGAPRSGYPVSSPPISEQPLDEWDPNDSTLEYSGAVPMVRHSALLRAAQETRMMTRAAPSTGMAPAAASVSPMGRMRQKAQSMLLQLRRLVSSRVSGFGDATVVGVPPPSPALVAALAEPHHFPATELAPRPAVPGQALQDAPVTEVMPSVQAMASELRRHADDIKAKAERPGEKATIEIVALMFQAILAEEHIPASIRVWFARLQIPVLRLALAEPDFFASSEHPARQLIDRMGACAMGFDAAQVEGSALEREIKRIVQTIEQYPETGRRVYQMMLDEFKRFLGRSLAENHTVKRVSTLAQQVEQKETLAVQYTIELRRMLESVPVAEDVREFLFHIWSDVLALAAVRYGAQGEQTLHYKQTAADLLWAASPRPDRAERSRVVQRMSGLLAALREGMSMAGIQTVEQDGYIKLISDAVTRAFTSRDEGLPREKLEELAHGLAALEDVISDTDEGDMMLDPSMIEMMFGSDIGQLEVIAQGGSMPGQGMLAWARELEIGTWFLLDWAGSQLRVQYAWHSARGQLHLFAAGGERSFLVQTRRLAAYLQAGLLVPLEDEALTVRATRRAINQLDATPQMLLQ